MGDRFDIDSPGCDIGAPAAGGLVLKFWSALLARHFCDLLP